MAGKNGSDVRAWFDGLEEGHREQAEKLARLVGAADSRIERAVKWGRVTFTVDGRWHDWLCAIAVAKKGVRLVFHKGALLEDPEGLLAGSARYVREITAERVIERPAAVHALIGSALDHQTDLLD
jgi:hypothetical protein